MIGVYRTADGVLENVVVSTAGMNMAGRATRTAPDNRAELKWDTTARDWVPDLVGVQARLLDQIDDERERRQMTLLTQGGAKKLIYARKEAEVRDYRSLTASVLALIDLAGRRARFPFAMAEVDRTGEALAAVVARFEAGFANMATVARIEAVAQAGKRAVRGAATVAAKRAAFAAINWN